jgi:hypothetical protein
MCCWVIGCSSADAGDELLSASTNALNLATASATFVLIAPSRDLVSNALAEHLRTRGQVILHCVPEEAGDLKINVGGDQCRINGQQVSGILFRALPTSGFAHSYGAADQTFCDSELSAVWLAILNLPSVWAANSYDAEAWYDGLRWITWHRKLQRIGIPVWSRTYGGVTADASRRHWLPYTGSELQDALDAKTHALLGSALGLAQEARRCLVVCGQVIDGERSAVASEVLVHLDRWNLRLAEIAVDEQGRIGRLDPLPDIGEVNVARNAAERLAKGYYEHLCRWGLV